MPLYELADGHGVSKIGVDVPPSHCPYCAKIIEPVFRHAYNQPIVQIVFQCSSATCRRLFVAFYGPPTARSAGGTIPQGSPHVLKETVPRYVPALTFQPEVNAVSASYVEIFTQAHTAEGLGLLQVAGCGYRKALEFLIKDYCIACNPDMRDAIAGLLLGTVINNFVDHPTIKAMAARAAWLGNDETHYVRKWANKDITDLKKLIELTVAWVVMHEQARKIEAEMPAGR